MELRSVPFLPRYAMKFAAALALSTLLAPIASAQLELYELHASDAAPGDEFGLRLDMDSGLIVVGAWQDSLGVGPAAGSAYLYMAGNGQELRKFTASDAAADDWYGISVGVSAPYVVVGSCNDDDFGPDSGAAYVHTTGGAELFKLTASNAAAGDLYGARVDIEGTTLVVGSPFGDGTSVDTGAAYVYSAITGQELAKLEVPGASSGDLFGMSAAISSGLVVVGALGADPLGVDSGAAYVFDAATGQLLQTLTAFDGAAGHNFGARVEIEGDRVVVGSWFANGATSGTGAAYVFDATSGAFLKKLTALDGQNGDAFGSAVALSGDRIGVGAPNNGSSAGAVYLFDALTGNQLGKLQADDAAAGDEFFSLALEDDLVLVGARKTDDNGQDSGSAYLYYVSESPALPYCFGDGSSASCPCGNPGAYGAGCSNSSSVGGRLAASGTNSASLDDLSFQASDLLPGQPALLFSGLNQVQAGNGALFGDGLRCAGGSVKRLGVRTPNANGEASWGSGLRAAGGWNAGDTRRFQCWYRDPSGFCGSAFNLTNGLEVVFQM